MDKNMISIDDLVKQRLSDGEEQERSGAWSNMRSLLDKEMPRNEPVAIFNWRRVATVVAGVALLAAVSVGGYEMITTFRADNANKNLISDSGNTNSLNNNSNSNFDNSKKPGNSNVNTVVPATAASPEEHAVTHDDAATKTVDNKKVANKGVTGNLKVTGNSNTGLHANAGSKTTEAIIPNSVSGNKANTPGKVDNELKINDKKDVNDVLASKGGSKTTLPQQPKAIKESTGTAPAKSNVAAAGANATPAPGNADTKGGGNQPLTTPPAQPAKKGNDIANNADKSKDDKSAMENAKKEKQFKDSINMIATKEKYSVKQGWVRDTVQTGKLARYDVVPVDPAKAVAINDIIPASSVAVNDDVKMEPLEKNKVSAKKTRNSYGEGASRFEDMIKATKFNMSKITFHAGVMGGVNSSIAASNSTMGFQLGMFGAANISERISVFTEIKYTQRWGGSNSVSDNYNANKQELPASAGMIEHTWDSVEHSFKYPMLNSIHIPLAVRYAVKRISLFCGADFGYNFAVSAEEIEQPHGIRVSQVTPLSAEGLRYDYTKTGPSITYKDFSQRMDLGGVLGVSYSLTPSTMIDLRVVQSMWNNASSKGEITVYEELYNNPSIQFNISYRFRNNKFRAYRR